MRPAPARGLRVKGTELHDTLGRRIRECIVMLDQLYASDPTTPLGEAKWDLRRALSAVQDRAAAVRLMDSVSLPRPAKPTWGDRLRELQADRARFPRPRRWGFFGSRGR